MCARMTGRAAVPKNCAMVAKPRQTARVFEGLGEVAAVFGEDGKDGEDGRDALGHGLPGPIRWGIG